MTPTPPPPGIPPAALERIVAAADLVGRTGASQFELGYLDDTPRALDARWWAAARYQGARVTAENHLGPDAAAEALALKLLDGGGCVHCGRTIRLGDVPDLIGQPGGPPTPWCRWRRAGDRWEPGCVHSTPTNRPNRAARRRAAQRRTRP